MANRWTLERSAHKVIQLVLQGLSDKAVAERMSTARHKLTPQAVTAFRKKHARELQEARGAALEAVQEIYVETKRNRLLALNDSFERIRRLIEARAADDRYGEPGYDTGLLVHELKAVGSGDNMRLVSVFKADTAVLAELRATLRAAAEELAQIERPPAAEVNLGVNVGVMVRTVMGYEGDIG